MQRLILKPINHNKMSTPQEKIKAIIEKCSEENLPALWEETKDAFTKKFNEIAADHEAKAKQFANLKNGKE